MKSGNACFYSVQNLLSSSLLSINLKIKIQSSSSSLAQQPLLSQDLLQKLLPVVSIPCSIPPISLPQLPGVFRHAVFPSQFRPSPLSSSITNSQVLKSFHRPSCFGQSGHCFFGFRNKAFFSGADELIQVVPGGMRQTSGECSLS